MSSGEYDNRRLLDEIDELDDDTNNKKNRFKEKLKSKENIIIVIILIIVIGVAIYYYGDLDDSFIDEIGNDDYEIDYETELAKEEKIAEMQKQNIIVSKNVVGINKELILGIENNNDTPIYNFEIYVVFYDSENEIVGINSENINYLKNNGLIYLKFFETPEVYERYDTFINKTSFYDDDYADIYKNEYISYTSEKVNDKISITVTNNYTEDIEYIDFIIVYYDEQDNILDISNAYALDIPKNEKITIEDYGVWDYLTEQKLEYAKYEVILNNARYDI